MVSVEKGKQTFRPEGRDEVSILKSPVKVEHFVEVQGQTAAVVHHNAKLLFLETETWEGYPHEHVWVKDITYALLNNATEMRHIAHTFYSK